MCGIVCYIRNDGKSAAKSVMKRYRKQKTRGTQGFGYISIDSKGRFHDWKRAKFEHEIEKEIKGDQSSTILFHHRFPTSTPNFAEASHPIHVSNERLDHDYYVVHNGMITNDEALKEAHGKEGYEYTTTIIEQYVTKDTIYSTEMFNDSEALAIEIAKVLDGDQKDIEAEGSIAFIALQVNKHSKKVMNIFYGRNYANPLRIHIEDNFISLASEGIGESIEADVLHKYDLETKTITSRKLDIGNTIVKSDRYAEDDGYYGLPSKSGTANQWGYDTHRHSHLDDDPTDPLAGFAPPGYSTGLVPYNKLPIIDAEEKEEGDPSLDDMLYDAYEERSVLQNKVSYYESVNDVIKYDKALDDLIDVNIRIRDLETMEDLAINEENEGE